MKKKTWILFVVLAISHLMTSCKKDKDLATLDTSIVNQITGTTAVSGGSVTSDGGSVISQMGVCWSKAPNPTLSDFHTIDGNGTGNFTSKLKGLEPTTLYFIRAYAVNEGGTAYGDELSFTTTLLVMPGNGLSDREGHTYTSIILGQQEWMAENLRTMMFANGNPITMVSDNNQWVGLTTGAWCWYDNLESNEETYGKLYNGFAVLDPRGICPGGWHLPDESDWATLVEYLGGESVAGGKMKESGIENWISPNEGATNLSDFAGRPGGFRYAYGAFTFQHEEGWWWSSTAFDANQVWSMGLGYLARNVTWSYHPSKGYGLSVRCLKD